jgi:hypothetical protein
VVAVDAGVSFASEEVLEGGQGDAGGGDGDEHFAYPCGDGQLVAAGGGVEEAFEVFGCPEAVQLVAGHG